MERVLLTQKGITHKAKALQFLTSNYGPRENRDHFYNNYRIQLADAPASVQKVIQRMTESVKGAEKSSYYAPTLGLYDGPNKENVFAVWLPRVNQYHQMMVFDRQGNVFGKGTGSNAGMTFTPLNAAGLSKLVSDYEREMKDLPRAKPATPPVFSTSFFPTFFDYWR